MVTFNRNTAIKFPVPYGTLSGLDNLAAISPFWCLASSRQPNGSGTYYETLSKTDLAIHSEQIRSGFNKPGYLAIWGLQVTWENLTSDGAPINNILVRIVDIIYSIFDSISC